MVSTLTSPRVSASSPKSGEMSVVVTVWECCHMPFQHYNWRCSNTLYAFDTRAVLPLWNLTPSLTHFPHEASSCNHNHHPPKHTAHVWHHPRLQKRGSCLSNPKSHSQTMVNSSRSRKQLQSGEILAKWDGTPLINKETELGKPRPRAHLKPGRQSSGQHNKMKRRMSAPSISGFVSWKWRIRKAKCHSDLHVDLL